MLDIPPEKIVKKDRLRPGRMLLIDTESQSIIEDSEIKKQGCVRASLRPVAEGKHARYRRVAVAG